MHKKKGRKNMKIGANGIIVFKMLELDINSVDKVIFTFSGIEKLQKEYPSEYVSFSNGRFLVGLTQQDTIMLSHSRKVKISVEAQLCYKNGAVTKSDIITFTLDETLGTSIVPGNSPSDSVNDLELHYENGILIVGGEGSLTDSQIRQVINSMDLVDGESLSDAVSEALANTDYVTGEEVATYVEEHVSHDSEWISELLGTQLEDLSDVPSGVSVKDFGAVGDGTTDDSQAFLNALAEHDVLLLPRGSYNLNFANMSFTKNVTLIGEHPTLTSILNSNISAPYGITCENITFNGGTQREFEEWTETPSSINESSIILLVTPKSNDVVVDYENCVFTNADFGSFCNVSSSYPDNKFAKNIVNKCIFTKLTTGGISHNANIEYASVSNSTFKEIGERERITYPSPLMVSLGDLSNRSNNKVTDCYIRDNAFDTLISGDDINFNSHTISANMIKVQGDNITITYNRLSNKVGLTADSEAIYTKGQRVEIAYNTLEDCFGGEGFICCKASNFYDFLGRMAYIHDNQLVGDYGTAFAVYGAAKIINNTINIKKMLKLIQANGRANEVDGFFEFRDNRVLGGLGEVIINGERPAYFNSTPNSGNFIYAYNYPAGMNIENNNITLVKDDSGYNIPRVAIKLQNVISDVSIKNNKMVLDTVSTFFEINGVADGTTDLIPVYTDRITVDVLGNSITSATATSIGMLQFMNESAPFKVIFNIEDNVIKDTTGITGYAYNLQVPSSNDDVLNYDSKQAVDLVPSRHVFTRYMKDIFTTNLDFITSANANIELVSETASNIDFGNEVV